MKVQDIVKWVGEVSEMAVAEKLMTVEEFWERYADQRYELIRGEVVEIMPNSEHGKIAALLTAFLVPYVLQRHLGWVRVETHYELGEHIARVPDVSFISKEREAQIPDGTKFIPFAPALAIEIISPSESHTAVRDKINDYRNAGTEVMWLVYPDTKAIEVHYLQQDRLVRFSLADTLTLDAVLPGFELPLTQIFVAPE